MEELRAGYADLDILRGVSLEADAGEVIAVIGPNGAGKSTLLKAAYGLVAVRSGRVLVDGRDVTNKPPHELTGLGLAYVPQLANTFPNLTIDENLEMGAFLGRQDVDARRRRILGLFPDLAGRRSERVGRLSGGQRQMVAIARALMAEPRVILLDEPSAGLAPQLQTHVFDHARRLADDGLAVLLVEQNARRALAVSDRAYILEQGRNRFDGAAKVLLADPDLGKLFLGG